MVVLYGKHCELPLACYSPSHSCCSDGDLALLQPANKTEVHECVVHIVTRDCVILRISSMAKEAWSVSHKGSIHYSSFLFSRLQLSQLHIFPAVCTYSNFISFHAPSSGQCAIRHHISCLSLHEHNHAS